MKKLILSVLLSIGLAASYAQTLPNIVFPSTSASTSTAYAFNVTNYGTSYNDKIAFVKFLIDNTGPVTVNINAIGAKALRKLYSGSWVPLVAGDLQDSVVCILKYDQASGYMRVINMYNQGGSGSSTFVGLTDGPGAFTGKSLNFVRVNTGETALEYQTPSQVRTDIGAQASGSYAVTTNNLSDLSSASTARINLGATTIGSNLFTLTNPSAITFPRYNADNTVSALSASAFRTAIGAGTGNGDLVSTNNLSDLTSASTARTNLGLGSLATQNGTAPSGTIVGTTDTQVLTNKDLTSGTNSFPTFNQNTTGSSGSVANALTVDNSSLQLNTGTTYNGSAARTISVKNLGITNAMLAGGIDLTSKVTGLLPDGNISSASTWNAKESALTFSAPLSRSGNTISIPAASGSVNGYLSSTDWTTFNSKVSSQWTTTGSDIYYNTGNVMIGANAAPSTKFHIVETSTSTPRGILADQYSTGTSGSRITMRKARGTFASPTTIVTGDVLGSWTSSGYDGASFVESGKILSTSVGTIGTNIVPSKMEFQTANSSGTLTTGLTIDQSQNVTIAGTIGASNLSGTNTGDQTITLTGDVTGTGTGSFATTIGANKVVTSNIADANVTLAKMANVATSTVFYRKTAGTGVPEVQTLATLKTDLGLTGTNSGDQTITLTGDVTGSGTGSFAATLTNSAVTGQPLTGYVSGSGTISATDNILQAIQKLNGNDAGKWSLASGGTLTGVNTITSNANSQINFGGTWTATGNSQYHVNIGGTLTSLTGNSTLYGTLINTAMTAGAASHTLSLLRLDGSNMSTTNSPTRYVLNALGSVLITTSSGTGASSLTINNSTGSVSTNFDVQNTGTSVFKVSSSGSVTFAPSTATTAAAYTFAGNAQTATSGAQNIFTVSTSNKAGANNDVLSVLNITSTMDVNAKTGVNMQGIYYNPTVTGSPNLHFAWQHTSGYVQWNSVLSPAQITSNQNDYNPTGLNTGGAPNGASILRVTTDASRNLTSVVGGATGRLLIIANVGSFDLVIKNDDGSTGTAANRFALNADITLSAGKSLMFWYDGTSSRWRVNSL